MNPVTYLWNILSGLFPKTIHTAPVKPLPKESHKKWLHDDDTFLMTLWESNAQLDWLPEYFGRSEASIKSRLIKLGYSTKKDAPRTREI